MKAAAPTFQKRPHPLVRYHIIDLFSDNQSLYVGKCKIYIKMHTPTYFSREWIGRASTKRIRMEILKNESNLIKKFIFLSLLGANWPFVRKV